MNADPFTDFAIVVHKALNYNGILAGGTGPVQRLLHRQQKLGDHVPVNATQPLIFVERARAAGEGLVIEDLLIQRENACIFPLGQAQL